MKIKEVDGLTAFLASCSAFLAVGSAITISIGIHGHQQHEAMNRAFAEAAVPDKDRPVIYDRLVYQGGNCTSGLTPEVSRHCSNTRDAAQIVYETPRSSREMPRILSIGHS